MRHRSVETPSRAEAQNQTMRSHSMGCSRTFYLRSTRTQGRCNGSGSTEIDLKDILFKIFLLNFIVCHRCSIAWRVRRLCATIRPRLGRADPSIACSGVDATIVGSSTRTMCPTPLRRHPARRRLRPASPAHAGTRRCLRAPLRWSRHRPNSSTLDPRSLSGRRTMVALQR